MSPDGGGGAAVTTASESSLGYAETEVFELFQRHRCKLLRWLESYPAQRNAVMEAVVRTVTCTGPRRAVW